MPNRRRPSAAGAKARTSARPRRPSSSTSVPTPSGAFPISKTQSLVQRIRVSPSRLGNVRDDAAATTAEGLSALYAEAVEPRFGVVLVPGRQVGQAELTGLAAAYEGSVEAAKLAGVSMLGVEPLSGLSDGVGVSLTGMRKGNARAPAWGGGKGSQGDVLLLTQAVGTGIAQLAVSQGLRGAPFAKRVKALCETPHHQAGAVLLRRRAAIRSVSVLGARGLMGELEQLATRTGMRVTLLLEQLPLVEEVPSLAAEGVLPEAATATLEGLSLNVTLPEGLPPEVPFVLASPEVNGGLLAVVPAKEASRVLRLLDDAGAFGALVGELRRGPPGIDVG